MTMTELDPSEIILGINNGPGIYIAPEHTQGPADLTSDWAAPWKTLGYLSEDGPSLSSDVTSETLTPWQSTSPVRTVITGKAFTLHVVMWQTGPEQLALYFDVKAPNPNSDGSFAFTVRSDEGGYVYAVGIDIKDGDVVTRIVFPRAQVSDSGDVPFARGSAVGWDVTLSAQDDAGVLAYIQSGKVPNGNGNEVAASAEARTVGRAGQGAPGGAASARQASAPAA